MLHSIKHFKRVLLKLFQELLTPILGDEHYPDTKDRYKAITRKDNCTPISFSYIYIYMQKASVKY